MATQGMSEKAAAVVRKALEEKNRTQEWLAAESGIPMRTLARRLHKHNPSAMSLDDLSAIATALDTDVVTLLIAARDSRSVLAVAS
ncbi:helix-turn-helix domain-containing protein [Microbacterium sp.]|uniref:helix-turn-helix domain-containing protein n=1 Tax=Microbacterium sp. TaxID=51671 RepID=UPI003A940126